MAKAADRRLRLMAALAGTGGCNLNLRITQCYACWCASPGADSTWRWPQDVMMRHLQHDRICCQRQHRKCMQVGSVLPSGSAIALASASVPAGQMESRCKSPQGLSPPCLKARLAQRECHEEWRAVWRLQTLFRSTVAMLNGCVARSRFVAGVCIPIGVQVSGL
jgi:hypothetical protein